MKIKPLYLWPLLAVALILVVAFFWPTQTESMPIYGTLPDHAAAVAKATTYLGGSRDVNAIDTRLIHHSDFAALMQLIPHYDEPDQPYQADSLVWATAVTSAEVASLPMFGKENKGALFFFSAGNGELLGMTSVSPETDDPTLKQLAAMKDLAGTVEILPIELKLPIDVPPTATPVVVSQE